MTAITTSSPTTAEHSQPRVEMRGIRKSYGALDVLRGVDLSIARGEVIGERGDVAGDVRERLGNPFGRWDQVGEQHRRERHRQHQQLEQRRDD